MKKRICAGLTILLVTIAIAFASIYEEQQQAKSAGYDYGYANPKVSVSIISREGNKRGYSAKNGLNVYFVDGAKIGQNDKKAGNPYMNPFNTASN